MDTGFGFQVSVKPGEKPMINIRGIGPGDFDANLDWATANAGKINDVVALLGGQAPQPVGVSVIQRELGGVVIGEYDTPPPSQPVQAYSAPPAYQQQPQPQPYPQSWPPADLVPPPGWAQPPAPTATHCARCKKVPACETCGQPASVVPMAIKDGAYFKHECPSGDRNHKTIWCNLPK